MSRSAHSVALSLALSAGAIIMPYFTIAQEHPVVAEELVKLRASGKVMTALWTVRQDVYTLQLVLPVTVTAPPRPAGAQAARHNTAAPARPQPAHIQVWLLRADGTQILPINQWPRPIRKNSISYEVSYTFALADGSQAIAAAVMINDDFYIDRLKPLVD